MQTKPFGIKTRVGAQLDVMLDDGICGAQQWGEGRRAQSQRTKARAFLKARNGAKLVCACIVPVHIVRLAWPTERNRTNDKQGQRPRIEFAQVLLHRMNNELVKFDVLDGHFRDGIDFGRGNRGARIENL